jgi:hypothetical protein
MDHDGMDRLDGLDGLDRDGARWIEELPAGLAAQQGLLRGLRAFSQADPDVRWLAVGCSLARDAGDWLSDIDAAVGVDSGVEEERFAEVFPRVRSAVDGLGELVESYHHKLPGLTLTHERIFAQYADRSQLDLVVYPSTVFAGSIPNVVVLYDPDSVLAVPVREDSSPVSASQVREWAFQGWCALADLGKYIRRGSAWEALERLHEARAQVWQLWAAVRGVPQPQYGLTSVLDYSASRLPPGIEETVSDLDLGRLVAAGLRVAELLGLVGGQLGEEQRAALPLAMGRFITDDLRAARVG